MMTPAHRYAIYFAPGFDTALWRFGCETLGRDALSGQAMASRPVAGLSPSAWSDLTAEPRRYGFHATLKAPFRLQSMRRPDELMAHARSIAATRPPIEIAGLSVVTLGSFVALTPSAPSSALDRLAGEVVESFEPFRAPLTASERARRMATPLTDRQRLMLERWGYPYVFEEFRFHMTLTGSIPDADLRESVRRDLAARHAEEVGEGPVSIDGLSVFEQTVADGDFIIADRYRIKGAPR